MQALEEVDIDLGFLIEVKYPMDIVVRNSTKLRLKHCAPVCSLVTSNLIYCLLLGLQTYCSTCYFTAVKTKHTWIKVQKCHNFSCNLTQLWCTCCSWTRTIELDEENLSSLCCIDQPWKEMWGNRVLLVIPSERGVCVCGIESQIHAWFIMQPLLC